MLVNLFLLCNPVFNLGWVDHSFEAFLGSLVICPIAVICDSKYTVDGVHILHV